MKNNGSLKDVGKTESDKWKKTVMEIDEKIRKEGPWASARLDPLNNRAGRKVAQ